MTAPNIFVTRRPPVRLIKVTAVDDAYAYTAPLSDGAGPYPIPIADYDAPFDQPRSFVGSFRPATEDDLATLAGEPDDFRLPAGAPKSWGGDGPEYVEPRAPKR